MDSDADILTRADRAMWATERALAMMRPRELHDITKLESLLRSYAEIIHRVAFSAPLQ